MSFSKWVAETDGFNKGVGKSPLCSVIIFFPKMAGSHFCKYEILLIQLLEKNI